LSTAFTVSVDVKHGLTTGISAEERTNTVRALANGNSGASDFVRPGHVFPLVARDGGVLMRSGHTEACIDLCKLAGVPEVGVLSELMNDDGTVNRSKLPAIFNSEDRAALELALRVKDRYGGTVTAVTMGPPRATGQRSLRYQPAWRAIRRYADHAPLLPPQ
jgi:hypothetical protein